MNFGPWELMIVGGIAFLFFGNRLPSMMRSLGQSMNSFKEGLRQGEIEPEVTMVERK